MYKLRETPSLFLLHQGESPVTGQGSQQLADQKRSRSCRRGRDKAEQKGAQEEGFHWHQKSVWELFLLTVAKVFTSRTLRLIPKQQD